jgi:hypothetical protein
MQSITYAFFFRVGNIMPFREKPVATINEHQHLIDEILRKRKCRTSPFFEKFSICLTENWQCEYYYNFGFKCLCIHSRHKEFADPQDKDSTDTADTYSI